MPDREYRGKLTDPDWRRDRAQRARAAQDTAEYHARRLLDAAQREADAAPPLSQATREKLALLLHPGAGHGS